ncbi:MAG TPA: glycosyltransferase family 9 protein [Pirellulales bacterium]
MGAWTRSPLTELEPRRVCLIKPSALGDVVHGLHVLSGLRKRWPQAKFSWVVNDGFADLLEGHPDLSEVIVFRRREAKTWGGMWNVGWELAARLRRAKFDLTIDMQGLLRSGLMTLATGAARRVGFANAREGSRWTYTDFVPVPTMETPWLSRYWPVVKAFGGPDEIQPARFGVTTGHRLSAAEHLAGLPRPLIGLHPGAQWVTKRWPPENFAKLVELANRHCGASLVLVGGPGDREAADQIAAALPRQSINLAGKTSLLELAALLERLDVFVSGDSGPMHLAAAVGCPCVSLFTCTSPLRFAPKGPQHQFVATTLACKESRLKTCASLACMSELSVARVWPTLRATLESILRRGAAA